MTNKILITWSVICAGLTVQMSRQEAMTWYDLSDGDVMAWSRHITGQDVNDLTSWDEFESVAVIPSISGDTKPSGDTNYEDQVWAVVKRTIDGNDYKFVERFTPLDWGDDPNYCWFVDCARKGASTGVNEQPGAPGGQSEFRSEAYMWPDDSDMFFWDANTVYLKKEPIPDSGVFLKNGKAVSDGTETVIGYADTVGGDSCIAKYDSALNVNYNYYVPTAGWTGGEAMGWLEYTQDDSYLYAFSDKHVYKFEVSTGNEVWSKSSLGIRMFDIDSSSNIYLGTSLNVKKYDSDLNLVTSVGCGSLFGSTAGYNRTILYDEDNDRAYIGVTLLTIGNPSLPDGYYHVLAVDLDGSNPQAYSFGDVHANPLSCILYGGYFYITSEAVGGVSVWKFDSDLNLIASASDGGPSGICVGHDGNIVVNYPSRTGTGYIRTYDTDLNLIKTNTMPQGTTNWDNAQLVRIKYYTGTEAVPTVYGRDPNYSPGVVEGLYACVYADGRPIGNYDTVTDANGTVLVNVEDEYDVVIAGLNYYSIYESFPLVVGSKQYYTSGLRSSIKDVHIDFYESMGCHVGVNMDDSVDWKFSDDNFATALTPVTEIKNAPLLWGTSQDPVIYLWEWDPIPMTVRGVYPRMNITIGD